MATRVKQVISKRIEGARVNNVRVMSNLTPVSTFCGPVAPPREICTGPKPVVVALVVWAEAVSAVKNKMTRMGSHLGRGRNFVVLSERRLFSDSIQRRAASGFE